MNDKKYQLDVTTDPETGDQMLNFTEEFLQEQDWRTGDTIKFVQEGDTWIMKNLTKEERSAMPLFIVETVSIFRHRYAIRAKSVEHAQDTVVMKDVPDEMSQLHLDELITSARQVTEQEYLTVFDQDNDYLKNWNVDQKKRLIYTIDYSE